MGGQARAVADVKRTTGGEGSFPRFAAAHFRLFPPTGVGMNRLTEIGLLAANALRTFIFFRRFRVSRVLDDWFEGAPRSETLRRIFAEA